jgi:hypothetical protein
LLHPGFVAHHLLHQPAVLLKKHLSQLCHCL